MDHSRHRRPSRPQLASPSAVGQSSSPHILQVTNKALICFSLNVCLKSTTNLSFMNRYGLSGAGGSDKTRSFANRTGSGCGHLSSLYVIPHWWILHTCVSNIWEAGRVTGEWTLEFTLTSQQHLWNKVWYTEVQWRLRLHLNWRKTWISFFFFLLPSQVSLNLEPLTEAYDSSSSGPVTDISIEGPQVTTLTVPLQPRSLSASSGKESAGSSGGNTPRFEVVAIHDQMPVSCYKSSPVVSLNLTVYTAVIFSEGRTTYISKMPRKTKVKKSQWRIRCREQTDLRTIKRLWILQVRRLLASQPMISSQVGCSMIIHLIHINTNAHIWMCLIILSSQLF